MEVVYGPANVEVTEWNPDGGNSISVTDVPVNHRPILIETSPEALAVYKDFYNRTAEEMLALEDDNIRGTYEKLRTYAARLALVIHVTRAVEQELFLKIDTSGAPWDRSERIDELECDAQSMRTAIALADWFKYEVRRVYSTWGGLADETPKPKGDPLQQKIVEFLEQKGGTVSLRDIQRKLTVNKEVAEQAVKELTDLDLIEQVDPPKGNRSPLLRLKSGR
jgi:hypothetical protein